jgi:hypothetical protein
MGKDYGLAVYSRDDFVWDKPICWCRLLEPAKPGDGQARLGGLMADG